RVLFRSRHRYLSTWQFEASRRDIAIQDEVVSLQLTLVVNLVLGEDRVRDMLWRSESWVHGSEWVIATVDVVDHIAIEALVQRTNTILLGVVADVVVQPVCVICAALPAFQHRHREIES